jgi:hypothetical protein
MQVYAIQLMFASSSHDTKYDFISNDCSYLFLAMVSLEIVEESLGNWSLCYELVSNMFSTESTGNGNGVSGSVTPRKFQQIN